MDVKDIKVGEYYVCKSFVSGIINVTAIHGSEIVGDILKPDNTITHADWGEYFGVSPSDLTRQLSDDECEALCNKKIKEFTTLFKCFFGF